MRRKGPSVRGKEHCLHDKKMAYLCREKRVKLNVYDRGNISISQEKRMTYLNRVTHEGYEYISLCN